MLRFVFTLLLFWGTPLFSQACCECHYQTRECAVVGGDCRGADCAFFNGACRNRFEVTCESLMKKKALAKQCPASDDHDHYLVRPTLRSAPAEMRTTRGCDICQLHMEEHGSCERCTATEGPNLLHEIRAYLLAHPQCRDIEVDNDGCCVLLDLDVVKARIPQELGAALAGGKTLRFIGNRSLSFQKEGTTLRPATVELTITEAGIVGEKPGACQYGAECSTWRGGEAVRGRTFTCQLASGKLGTETCCEVEVKAGTEYQFQKECPPIVGKKVPSDAKQKKGGH